MALTDATGHCLTLKTAAGWLCTTGRAGVSSHLLAHGTWQSQQGNALPRQEPAPKEQLGGSGHVLRAVAPRAAQLWVAGVSLCHKSVPAAHAGPAQVGGCEVTQVHRE